MSDRKHIEKRLRRLSGMSADKIEAMHAAAANEVWWTRCWNCKKTIEGKRYELTAQPCPHCNANLMSRS